MDVAKTPAVLTDCVFDHLLKSTENTAQQVRFYAFCMNLHFLFRIMN